MRSENEPKQSNTYNFLNLTSYYIKHNDIWTAQQQDLVWTVSLSKNIIKHHESVAYLLLLSESLGKRSFTAKIKDKISIKMQ